MHTTTAAVIRPKTAVSGHYSYATCKWFSQCHPPPQKAQYAAPVDAILPCPQPLEAAQHHSYNNLFTQPAIDKRTTLRNATTPTRGYAHQPVSAPCPPPPPVNAAGTHGKLLCLTLSRGDALASTCFLEYRQGKGSAGLTLMPNAAGQLLWPILQPPTQTCHVSTCTVCVHVRAMPNETDQPRVDRPYAVHTTCVG